MRPATAGSMALLRSDDAQEWSSYLDRYDEALSCVSALKGLKHAQMSAYDHWVLEEFPSICVAREKPSLDKAELEKFMQWKLWRGKDRPTLMSLVRQNSESSVSTVSAASFKLANEKHWREAITKMAELRGIGPATSTAILAALYPAGVVFMADEVIEAATGRKREYTMKSYDETFSCLSAKKKKLGNNWKIADVGRALWVAGILSLVGATNAASSTAENNTRKRKRGAEI